MAKKKSTRKKKAEPVEEEEESGRIDYGSLTKAEKKEMIAEVLEEGEDMSPDEKKAARVKLRKLGHEGGFGGRKAKAKTEDEAEEAPAKPAKKKRTRRKKKASAE